MIPLETAVVLCLFVIGLLCVLLYVNETHASKRLDQLEERVQFLEGGVHVEVLGQLKNIENQQRSQSPSEVKAAYRGPSKKNRTMWDERPSDNGGGAE